MKNYLKNHPKIYAIRYDILITLIVAFCIIFDILSKIFTDGITTKILGDFLIFSSTHNYGAAYGIFSGQGVGLIIVTSIILVAILVFNYFYKNKTILYSVSIGLIIGGAIGNLIDRIFLGYVRDFIKFSFFNFTCNIADICLTFGVVIFAIYLIFFDKRSSKKNKFKKTTNLGKINDSQTSVSEEKNDE